MRAPQMSRNPHEAERRKLTRTLDTGHHKITRLLDAYTDGALDLASYKRRRDLIQTDVEQAQARLAQLDQLPVQAPAALEVRRFVDTWPNLSVEARRDIAGALLIRVQVEQDKTVTLFPRCGEPVLVTFDKRGRTPQLSGRGGNAEPASGVGADVPAS